MEVPEESFHWSSWDSSGSGILNGGRPPEDALKRLPKDKTLAVGS